MRIRKRWLTTSSSSSLPHSQDLSSSPSTLQPPPPPHEELHHHHQNYPLCDPPNQSIPKQESTKPRSDLQLIIVKGTNGWIWSTGAAAAGEKRDDCMHPISSTQALQDDPILDGKREAPSSSSCVEEATATAIRERNKKISGASACEGMSVVLPSSSHHQGGKWCNGVSTQIYNKSTCIQLQEQDEGQVVDENELKDNTSNEMKIKKQRKKADKVSTMMAGSRCSRVNGRGWRCCQETLVGYSLCEHHLGKGRLRNKIKSTIEKQQGTTISTLLSSKPIMITKEAKKIGVVKARSLRSLLGQQTQTQTHHAPMVLPVLDSIITL
ncbi:Wrc protein [Thalictrum thalictroides]|uniref:Wrc protein n=1 Tax=Thalictrum thalictroides TaxID=46969 RepID=A0A7J6X3B3_THATH|nr:Wrc protein [Thalictrum thalictroides]